MSKVEAALKRYDAEEPGLFAEHCGNAGAVTNEGFSAYSAACSKLLDAVRRAFYHATYDVDTRAHCDTAADVAFMRRCAEAWRAEKGAEAKKAPRRFKEDACCPEDSDPYLGLAYCSPDCFCDHEDRGTPWRDLGGEEFDGCLECPCGEETTEKNDA